jgi:hypothetical protein
MNACDILHPVFSAHNWVPKSLALTPTLRVHDIAQLSIPSGAINPVVVLFQPLFTTGAGQERILTNIVGQWNTVTAPGTAGIAITPVQGAALASGRTRMHRMGLTISCLGPTLPGALLPSTLVRYGALSAPLDPKNYATFADVAANLLGRANMHSTTAYKLMTQPAHITAYPIDYTQWGELFDSSSAGVAANMAPGDQLSTIAVVLYTGATLDNFHFTLHVDWDTLPSDDSSGNSILTSAMVKHPVIPATLLDKAILGAQEVAGVFEKGAEVGKMAYNVLNEARMAFGAAPKSLPALSTVPMKFAF